MIVYLILKQLRYEQREKGEKKEKGQIRGRREVSEKRRKKKKEIAQIAGLKIKTWKINASTSWLNG